MKNRIVFAAALAAVFVCGAAFAQDASPQAAAKRRLMTWVPPYATTQSLNALKQTYGKEGPSKALTHLALQFWWPTVNGKAVEFSTDGTPNAGMVKTFVKWAHANKIKVMLCVYNAVPKADNPSMSEWNWDRAKNAFDTNRAKFVAALAAEVKKYDLDGVDIDFEGLDTMGTGDHDGDLGAYVAFVKDLKAALKSRNGEVTVDSFYAIYNAPNWNWWKKLLPQVDGLTAMGYADIGRNGMDYHAYSTQVEHAGKYTAKLQMGLPSDVGSWQGNTAAEQTAWFLTVSKVGVGIWDAQFNAAAWQQADVWKNLRQVKAAP